ncbi:hypothetical protein MPOCJGCO_0619 [Methylobacterium trifolii]|uniref:Uncharacterized protein n=1 Tax=Methylobacterium trifolii TaxID=1003092 RepID=A0ABQ4TWZ1_9HYPH|nr:hypothetical protein MPOCJGCO_0619 [Methylobacterium trifolii]
MDGMNPSIHPSRRLTTHFGGRTGSEPVRRVGGTMHDERIGPVRRAG